MAQPKPKPVDPSELANLARSTMAAAKFPMLATTEGDQPRLRPVSPVRVDGFTIYIANLRHYGKTAEIAANPRVELCYLDDEHHQVRITGKAETVSDGPTLASIWESNPLLRSYLGTIDNPDLIIYRVVPERVRYMREWALSYHEVPHATPPAGEAAGG
jgi:general stress protein 26